MRESTRSVKEIIDDIAKKNQFVPIENPNSTGMSPDLSDEDIEEVIERCSEDSQSLSGYKYYFDEENCILYKFGYEGSLEEYIADGLWNYAEYEALIENLTLISEYEADDLIKEMEGDEYDLIDGEVIDTCSEEENK